MRSQKQIEANRRNAQKSTGPKTAEGKAKVSRNALKHGLAGHGVVFSDEMAEAITERQQHWARAYRPDGPVERWKFQRICIESVRADSALHRAIVLRDRQAQRASHSWDDDRALEVETLGKRLPDRPELVVRQLQQTKHGALWLLDRWDDLACSASQTGGELRDVDLDSLLNLLGVPLAERVPNRMVLRDLTRPPQSQTTSDPFESGSESRPGPTAIDPGALALPDGLPPKLAAIIADAKANLRDMLDAYLIERDETARLDAMVGLGDESDETRRHELYEDRILRRLRQAEADLRRLQSGPPPERPRPSLLPDPAPAPCSPADHSPSIPDRPPAPVDSPAPGASCPPATSATSPASTASPSASRFITPTLSATFARQHPDRPQATNRRARRARNAHNRKKSGD